MKTTIENTITTEYNDMQTTIESTPLKIYICGFGCPMFALSWSGYHITSLRNSGNQTQKKDNKKAEPKHTSQKHVLF